MWSAGRSRRSIRWLIVKRLSSRMTVGRLSRMIVKPLSSQRLIAKRLSSPKRLIVKRLSSRRLIAKRLSSKARLIAGRLSPRRRMIVKRLSSRKCSPLWGFSPLTPLFPLYPRWRRRKVHHHHHHSSPLHPPKPVVVVKIPRLRLGEERVRKTGFFSGPGRLFGPRLSTIRRWRSCSGIG